MTTTRTVPGVDATLADLHRRYIAGELERPAYQAELAGIHAAMSAAANLGPCTCPGCTEHRAAAR